MSCVLERDEQGLCRAVGTISEAEVLSAWKKVAGLFAASVNIPGFRRGKAPLSVLEKQFGPQIAELATDRLVDEALKTLFQQEGITPVTGFDYQGDVAKRGQGLNFEVTFGILPEFEVPELSGIGVDRSELSADPVQEDLFLREMLSRGAEKKNVTDDTPKDGDLVIAEVEGRVDGQMVPGLSGPFRMRMVAPVPGEKAPELDTIVRKLRVGETGTGSAFCPPDYPDAAFRGRSIDVTVTLHGIEREILPVLNDESARKLGFRSAEAMRLRAHEQALDLDRLHKRSRALQGIQQLLEIWPGFDAPETLVKQCTREAITRVTQNLQQQAVAGGLTSTLDKMEEEAAKTGVRKARCRAILLGWAEAHGVELPQSEFDAVLRGRAARRQMDFEEYLVSTARSGEVHAIRAAMLEEKALYALYDELIKADRPAE